MPEQMLSDMINVGSSLRYVHFVVWLQVNLCAGGKATAPYFYGSILLRALKSKIILVLTYVSKTKFLSN
jgi:hypothetical protein